MLGVGLTLAFVAAEAVFGVIAGSTAERGSDACCPRLPGRERSGATRTLLMISTSHYSTDSYE